MTPLRLETRASKGRLGFFLRGTKLSLRRPAFVDPRRDHFSESFVGGGVVDQVRNVIADVRSLSRLHRRLRPAQAFVRQADGDLLGHTEGIPPAIHQVHASVNRVVFVKNPSGHATFGAAAFRATELFYANL